MLKRPPPSRTVYGITRPMLARLGRLSERQAKSLPLPDVETSIRIIAKRIVRHGRPKWWSVPCRTPLGRKPPLLAFYASYSLIYSPSKHDKDLPTTPPAAVELEYTARQLRAFGSRAKVVGYHVQIGRDLLSIHDARRLLPICESYQRPASRRLLIKVLQALGLTGSSLGRSRGRLSAGNAGLPQG